MFGHTCDRTYAYFYNKSYSAREKLPLRTTLISMQSQWSDANFLYIALRWPSLKLSDSIFYHIWHLGCWNLALHVQIQSVQTCRLWTMERTCNLTLVHNFLHGGYLLSSVRSSYGSKHYFVIFEFSLAQYSFLMLVLLFMSRPVVMGWHGVANANPVH